MTMVQAINNALDIKLAEDKRVVVYGEDVGVVGGVFRVTEVCRRSMEWSASSILPGRIGNCEGPDWEWRFRACDRW